MIKFTDLNIPISEHKFQDSKIYDKVRKKYVECIPEEWVRQNLIDFLVSDYGYMLSRMRVEIGFKILGKDYRSDIICYDEKGNPYLIVECKSPDIKLNQATLNQIGIYNIAQKTKFLLVTNGLEFLVFQTDYDSNKISQLNYIPTAQRT
ncbi:type I restriction enzyme HsdR N-terminal domain-containing protein [bacterium]|nr:MAG: type I restriction enzyme HsdR N-terminal domain-containing protein [bacterium]